MIKLSGIELTSFEPHIVIIGSIGNEERERTRSHLQNHPPWSKKAAESRQVERKDGPGGLSIILFPLQLYVVMFVVLSVRSSPIEWIQLVLPLLSLSPCCIIKFDEGKTNERMSTHITNGRFVFGEGRFVFVHTFIIIITTTTVSIWVNNFWSILECVEMWWGKGVTSRAQSIFHNCHYFDYYNTITTGNWAAIGCNRTCMQEINCPHSTWQSSHSKCRHSFPSTLRNVISLTIRANTKRNASKYPPGKNP